MEKQQYSMSSELDTDKRQYWAACASPQPLFSWPGWLYLLCLVLLALWGVFLTAPEIERQVEYGVRQQLSANNKTLLLEKTNVSVNGQHITISAQGHPNVKALAGSVAATATCATALFGPLRCPADVAIDILEAETDAKTEAVITELEASVEPSDHYFEMVSDGAGLLLSGEVASREIQQTISEELDAVHQQIDNQLRVSGRPSSSQDLWAARQASELLRLAEQGSVTWENGSFNARLLSTADNVGAIQALFDQVALSEQNAALELQLAETVSRCNQQFEQLFSENTIRFRIGSASISPESNRTLGAIAMLASDCDLRLDIEGHTDNAGSTELNKSLSLARANAVIVSLAAHGANPERFTAYGYGPEKPIADNATADGRRQNRRIEIRASKIN